MSATSTITAAAVRTFIQELVNTADYIQSPLRDLIPATQSPGGNAWKWNIKYGDNLSATTYSEGDAISAAGNTLTATASVAYSTNYVRTIFNVTGHALDYAKNGYFDVMQTEAESALLAHNHKTEDLLVAQLEDAVDSGGSYGGLLRSTYKLASYEAAVATLALSDLQTMWETLAKIEVVADMSNMVLLSTIDMLNEYMDVATGVQYQEFNSATTQGFIDAGKLGKTPLYNGRPWITIPTMTATTVLMLDPRNVKRIVNRPVTVEQLAKTDDSETFAITSCEIVVHDNPRKAGKLT